MAQTKGKQATKGRKQIVEDNKQTVQFWILFSIVPTAIYVSLFLMFWRDHFFTAKYITYFLFSVLVNYGCVAMMKYIARVSYGPTGSLIDSGIDLNMEGGFAEYFKDLVILNTIIMLTSLYSTYFWWLWLTVPGAGVYKFVTAIFLPWVFAPSPEVDEEKDEKKQRKLDRKMRRAGM